MGTDTAQTRTLQRALQTIGTAERLAACLGCDVPSLLEWLSGRQATPAETYIRALDIVSAGRRAPPGAKRT